MTPEHRGPGDSDPRSPDDDDLAARFEGADAPRPLPADLRARLEASLLAPHQTDPLPHALRRRLERSMAGTRVPVTRTRFLTAAAVLLLVVAAAAVVVRTGSGGGDGDTVAGGPRPSDERLRDGDVSGGSSGVSGDGTGATGEGLAGGGSGAPADGFGGGDTTAGGAGAAPTAGSGRTDALQSPPPSGQAGGPPPPFAYGDDAGTAGPPAAEEGATSPDTAAPIRIGVVHGDHDLEAGFLAYLDLLDAHGGIGGRRVVAVVTSSSSPARDTLATVNLSGAPLASAGQVPAWVRQPLLEGPAAVEDALTGSVWSFTSVLERQAHLAALAAFPQAQPGATAAIYHATSGPFADRVPAALEVALRTRGVAAVRVPTDPASPRFVPADAAFVSLPNGDAAPFLRAASNAGQAPEQGLWGIGSLFDEDLLAVAPAGLRLVSPYALPGPAEADAVRRGAERGLGTGVVHGWVTAKSLAVALWQAGATTPAELDAALGALAGYANGFMPPYEVRPGTRSRTPEGLVLVPRDGRFTAASPFRRDPL